MWGQRLGRTEPTYPSRWPFLRLDRIYLGPGLLPRWLRVHQIAPRHGRVGSSAAGGGRRAGPPAHGRGPARDEPILTPHASRTRWGTLLALGISLVMLVLTFAKVHLHPMSVAWRFDPR